MRLALADYVVTGDGIVSLDDYTNLNYSQILAATFKYLFTRHTNLSVFLVTAEKAYLCRRRSLPLFELFVLNDLQKMMAERGVADTCLARTDIARDYRAFYLRDRLPGETASRYGEEIYGDFYRVDQRSFATRVLHFAARKIRRKKYQPAVK